jgi:hypothetical protein
MRGAMSVTRLAAETHWVVSHMSQMTTAALAGSQSCRIMVMASPADERDRRHTGLVVMRWLRRCVEVRSDARVELRADRIDASAASFHRPLDCSNER